MLPDVLNWHDYQQFSLMIREMIQQLFAGLKGGIAKDIQKSSVCFFSCAIDKILNDGKVLWLAGYLSERADPPKRFFGHGFVEVHLSRKSLPIKLVSLTLFLRLWNSIALLLLLSEFLETSLCIFSSDDCSLPIALGWAIWIFLILSTSIFSPFFFFVISLTVLPCGCPVKTVSGQWLSSLGG